MVEFTILKISDTNDVLGKSGCINVYTQYKLDGKEVVSKNPPDSSGRYYFLTQYNYNQFAGTTEAQRLDRIKKRHYLIR